MSESCRCLPFPQLNEISIFGHNSYVAVAAKNDRFVQVCLELNQA